MNNTNNNYCVILAGGKGRRLWPCSRESKPKQFIDFFGSGRTQLQQTYDRFKQIVPVENIYVNTNDAYIDLVLEVMPTQVTLVPDGDAQLTSNHGWNTIKNKAFLTDVIGRFKEAGIRTSIFVDPSAEMVRGAKECGTDRVELYTESYASGYAENREEAIKPFIDAAVAARELGLGLNAGHDLSLVNLAYFHRMIPWTDEVSIGHAIICDALYIGLKNTIEAYLQCLK